MKQFFGPDFCIDRITDDDILTLSSADVADDSIVDRMNFTDIQF